MALPVEVSQKADQDVMGHYLSMDAANPVAADRFVAAVRATYEQLSVHPQLGRDRGMELPGEGVVRTWGVKGFRNYLIVYSASMKRVYVIRVLDGRRDIPAILQSDLE